MNVYVFIVPYSRKLTRIIYKLFYFHGKVRYTVIIMHALKKLIFNNAKIYTAIGAIVFTSRMNYFNIIMQESKYFLISKSYNIKII